MYAINAPLAREEYNTTGEGVIIAIVDTGADVAQPYLQVTPDGKRKIIAWRDDTGEGAVSLDYNFTSADVVNGTVVLHLTNVTIDWGRYYFYVDRASRYTTIPQLNLTVDFGNVTVENGTYKVGFLPERYFDINFDHNFDELYAIIVAPDNITYFYPVPLQLNITDANTLHAIVNGTLNTTILENMMVIPEGVNYTFTVNLSNAHPMTLFDQTGDYILLGPGVVDNTTYVTFELGRPGTMEVANGTAYMSVVLATLDKDEAVFGWDGGQHGTHVSGTAAGYGLPNTYFEGLEGVAPGAQLIEIKSLSSLGYGSDSWIISGMIHATLMGADVISMSLGGLYTGYNDGLESPENYFANLLTDWFGVVFAIAAGNDGPTTNTVGSPGDSDFVITVGNYWSGAAWEFWYGNYGVTGVADGPAMSSSRGPRLDGAVKPDVMAPGSFIFSSLPIWSVGYYGTWASDFWDGTSMATPHVSGAVALMISYAKAHGINYNPFLIKRAIMLSAKPVEGATPIDQGAGLLQVDKAIAEMINLSKEKTTFIYAGTTFGPYTNALGEKELPLRANVLFNGWFLDYGLPYLYQGIYLRNERPATVPVYVYGMVYDHGLHLVNGTYDISTSVPWLHVSTTKITADVTNGTSFRLGPFMYGPSFYQTTGMFYVTIDYSQLQAPGTYVGYIYIDDPTTGYIDGMVPVIVTVPINKGPTGELSDWEYPGQAKHYYIDVPVGTHELVVTMSIPKDANGNYMGRARPYIVDPRGHVVAATGPSVGFYYLGPGGPGSYTWVIKNPTPGTWELTVYSSTFTAAYTGYTESHYDIQVQVLGVAPGKNKYYFDYETPGNYTFGVDYTNTYGTLNVTPFAYGLGNLENADVYILNITQDEWQVVDLVNATPGQKLYYFRMGITSPFNQSADLDLYVVYFVNSTVLEKYLPVLYNQSLAQTFILYAYYGLIPGVKVYLDQVGPTADESFDLFMPSYGYYVAVVNGYDVPGGKLPYVYYRQVLKDNGQMGSVTEPFTFEANTKTKVDYSVDLSASGTYLGVVGLLDSNTGVPVTYAPVFFQVGMPTMFAVLYGKAELGKPSNLKLVLLDAKTLKPISGTATVYINSKEYLAVDGVVDFTMIPTSSEEELNVKVVSPNYQDLQTTLTLHVSEPVTKPVYSYDEVNATVALGQAVIVNITRKPGEVDVVADGPHGTNATITVILPEDAYNVQVTGADVLGWHVVKGKNAVYAVVTVVFNSPAEFTVKYLETTPTSTGATIISFMPLNYLYYHYITTKNATFHELYQKALQAGVNESILQQAMAYYNESMAEFQTAKDFAGGFILGNLGDFRLFIHLRKSYADLKKAIRLLQEALEAQGS
nr:S8 family serine peptidase [Thermococcus sp. 21S9]